MKVHFVVTGDGMQWIFGKFVLKMQACLKRLGIESDYGDNIDDDADINHFMYYRDYKGQKSKSIVTRMITHVDEIAKLNEIKRSICNSDMDICMSRSTMNWLVKMGVEKTKLAYADPAHDGCALIKKINIGIASRVYPDGRKNEHFFNNFARDLNPKFFTFSFMGAGWENQVEDLRTHGFEVVYYDDFIREEYFKFIQSLDYYLYTGHDEGQMGFVDAAAAGVPSIVTPQGYHLDAPDALTYPFDTYDELIKILLGFQNAKEKIINSVANWTWMDYTKKHLEIWLYLLGEKVVSVYKDGLNSNLQLQHENIAFDDMFAEKQARDLEAVNNKHRSEKRKNYIRNNGIISYILMVLGNKLRK